MEVGHRRFRPHQDAASRLEVIPAAANQQRRQVVVEMAIAVGQSGVTNSLDPGVMVAGYPAIDSREWRKASVLFRRLPELKRRIEELEALVLALTGQTPNESKRPTE